jgi:hypothetical protein
MKATIEFDDRLYVRLKIEAARRGRTIRELVTEGVRRVLDAPPSENAATDQDQSGSWRPAWLGALAPHAGAVDDHTMTAIRESIARARAAESTE